MNSPNALQNFIQTSLMTHHRATQFFTATLGFPGKAVLSNWNNADETWWIASRTLLTRCPPKPLATSCQVRVIRVHEVKKKFRLKISPWVVGSMSYAIFFKNEKMTFWTAQVAYLRSEWRNPTGTALNAAFFTLEIELVLFKILTWNFVHIIDDSRSQIFPFIP